MIPLALPPLQWIVLGGSVWCVVCFWCAWKLRNGGSYDQ